MTERVLITGGAGFIGRHVARALLDRGAEVRVLDALIDQVHGSAGALPFRPGEVDVRVGDVRDRAAVDSALDGVDRVVHLAAEVGVGQSMYAVDRYVDVNDRGTAVLLEALIAKPVRRLVVASSMSIYGEGLYRDADGALHEEVERTVDPAADQAEPAWDERDGAGRPLRPLATPETKRPHLASVYALTKYVQERLALTVAPAYGMEGVALRLFNVYGPGQALSNPYTGVLAIFASRLLNGRPPMVFEDGRQRRDFVHVEDVARAVALALEHPAAPGQVFNVGSGDDISIAEIATRLAAAMGSDLEPEITGRFRRGDVRHCFADISKARGLLGFEPRRDFAESLSELAEWVSHQEAEDRVDEARGELEARGLVS